CEILETHINREARGVMIVVRAAARTVSQSGTEAERQSKGRSARKKSFPHVHLHWFWSLRSQVALSDRTDVLYLRALRLSGFVQEKAELESWSPPRTLRAPVQSKPPFVTR